MQDLVCKLPGVMSAQLRQDDEGALCDIHILADTSRAPKQTVRDIQSALAARFSVDVDHKIISIAQIPAEHGEKAAAPRRLKYAGLEVRCEESGCAVCVRLTDGAREYSGTAAGSLDRPGRYRAVCTATAAALNEYLDARACVRFDELRLTPLPSGDAVVCSVCFSANDKTDLLVGSCIDRDDGGVSAVRAALDAVNRRLSLPL
ncbi:MAG: hypothetical protein VB092_09935 [Oscillospiraceae bacterium]|nr:hypothetical protein [Oscillospiraceae bacterium]